MNSSGVRLSLGVLVVALSLVGCGGGDSSQSEDVAEATPSPSPTARTLGLNFTHDFVPYDGSGITRENDNEGSSCGITGFTKPTDDLAHMEPGGEVIVKNAEGAIVGKNILGNGRASNIQPDPANTYTCTWRANVNDVPPSTFYEISVQGKVIATVSASEVESTGGILRFPATG